MSEELIARHVNTIAAPTIDAFRDHANCAMPPELAGAPNKTIWRSGNPMKEVTDKLTNDGVKLCPTPSTNCWPAVAKSTQQKA